jgi:phosphoglycolate phosphatase
VKAVIFDLDGTLVDSAPDIHATANALLHTHGQPPVSYAQLVSFIGNGIPKLVERLMRARDIEYSTAQHTELTDEFVALYRANPTALSEMYPGVQDMLATLSGQKIALGVCTNKNHDLAVQMLQELAIDGFFGSVIGGDSLPQRKPDPAPLHQCAHELAASDIVYVGDSETDANTAVACTVPFAFFTKGYRKLPISEIPHDQAFDDFAALPAMVNQMFKIQDKT